MMILGRTPLHSLLAYPTCNQISHTDTSWSHLAFSIGNCYSDSKSTSLEEDIWRQCEYIDLHNELVSYRKAWALQKAIVKEKKTLIERNQECPDAVIILQHLPVFTLGTRSSEQYLNFDLNNPQYDVVRTERGGEVTYHGPGQLIMYPIINLRNHKMDLHWYLRALEEVVIRALFSTFGIKASRLQGLTGVWVGDQKLAAIGIRVSHWVTYHGLALNVSVDLTPFRLIVPCGIRDRGVGSIKGVLGRFQASNKFTATDLLHSDDSLLIDIAHEALLREFSQVFRLKLEQRSLTLSNLLWEVD
ncbi:hypothetical protein Nepgr_025027 [Nepenthes gracilis]|uniref:lipoyl(octanoyl) transferase n=1 Tax=Nepenthes gracilis TaxID=150966 RepID=A0AAD3T5I3_NEPGR|nr:hypothetical protein Nepgr_025027 [Nepenthes gracilis]